MMLFLVMIFQGGYPQNNVSDRQITPPPSILKGIITDTEGNPLAGATVQNKNNGKAVVAAAKGDFEILAKKGDVLEINFVGMEPRLYTVTQSNQITIALKDDNIQLSEVVVTGYQRINSRVFVGASAKVKAEDIQIGGTQDVSKMLEGRVPGLNISTVSAAFGTAPKINIRGGASINGSVQPLWVIDGAVFDDIVPMSPDQLTSGDAITLLGSAIAGLNVSDIESIEVLKDASATSLYGARGMNGVIVISTKSGKRGSGLSVNYNFESAIRIRPSYSQYGLLNSQQGMSIFREMENKGYFSMNDALYGRRGGVYTQMYQAINNYQNEKYGIINTEEEKIKFLRKAERYNTDWFKEIYRMNPTQNHSLSLSYGGEKSATYASMGVYMDAGEALPEKVNRFTAYMKTTYHFADNLRANISLQGNLRDQNAPGTFPRIQNVELGAFKRDFDINPFNYAISTSRTLRPYNDDGAYEFYRNDWAPFNILNEYTHNKMHIKMSDIQAQFTTEWDPAKDLKLSILFNARRAMTNLGHAIGERSNVLAAHRANTTPIEQQNNIYLYRDYNNPYDFGKVAIPLGGIYHKTTRILESFLGRVSVDYAYKQEKHNLKLFSYAEARKTDNYNDYFSGYGISFERANTLATIPLIFNKILRQGGKYFSLNNTFDRGISLSTSLTYDFRHAYILNATFNYEGSNISGIGTRVRWLPTWNIGAKWNIDDEAFFKPLTPSFSKLSLRSSYGLVAKMNPAAINSLPVYNSGLTFHPSFDDREYAILIKSLENRDLTWEKMYEFNIGIDAGFLNNRIETTVDLYHRNSFDLIDLIRTSGIGGEFYKWANFGDMRTQGIDISLRTENIKNSNFTWSTGLSFSIFKQEITRLINTPTTFDLVAGTGRGNLKGYPRSGLYSYEFTGLTDRGLPQFYFGDLPVTNKQFANISGANFYDVRYNKSYLLYNGPTDPYLTGGISNSISYKNWQLSAFITYQIGNKVRIDPTFDPEFGDINVFGKQYYDRWIHKGDELRTNVPVIPGNDLYRLLGKQNIERAYNTYNYSNVNVADGSFVRMRNISLTYNLPGRLCKAIRLQHAGVSFQATNPFLIYSDAKLRGRDPEFVNSGGVASPVNKTYTISINAHF